VREPILDFLRVARGAGLGIVPGDALDVFAALDATGYADRETMHASLRMLLARSDVERERFDLAFARYFGGAGAPFVVAAIGEATAWDDFDSPEIAAAIAHSALARVLLADDRAALVRDLHAAAADADVNAIRLFTQTSLFTQRLLDRLDLPALGNAIGRLRSSGDPKQQRAAEFLDDRERAVRELARDIVERRLAKAANLRATERDAFLREARLANIEPRDRERMRELVRTMAKRLATRHARMRRERRGTLDVRRTVRANIAHDGVLVETIMRTRKIERPKLVVLCDVSGSVAALAQFLLLFVHALGDEIVQVRSFAFSGPLVEITEIVRRQSIDDAFAAVMQAVGMRSSDYGRAFSDFTDGFRDAVDRKTTVVILGDGRTNYADPRLDLVAQIAQRARRVIWLNPEHRVAWGMDDSEMLRYLPLCTVAKTCNRLRHLEAIIGELVRPR
jgi:uncharacterized protein with von Willebrand factor type A (vWA) domain